MPGKKKKKRLEEMKSANEEIMSMNEEVQSANEELESSKEELQSLNEELSTVNSQLQEKVEELEAASNDMANLFNSADIGILFLDTSFRIKRFTPAVTRLFKLIPGDVGRPLSDIAPRFADPDLLADAGQVLHRLILSEKKVGTEDGRWCIRSIVPYRTEDNRIEGVVITFVDITERKRGEQALKKLNEELEQRVAAGTRTAEEKEERLRAILNGARDAIISFDPQGTIESANPATVEMFGYSSAELVGASMTALIPSAYLGRSRSFEDLQATRNMLGSGGEVVARRRDGSTFPVDLVLSEVGRLKLFTAIVRDITRRKQLEGEVLEIAALEQRRIGQDLHDHVGQELTALGLHADGLAEALQERAPAGAESARKLRRGLANVVAKVRTISRGLFPVDVDAQGLGVALAELAERLETSSGVHCTFAGDRTVSVGDNLAATHLFHIAQEACANALKHGQARNIDITLQAAGDHIVLQISDDGTGLRADADLKKGLGLRIMQNRASVINAEVTIGAAQPHGTVVTCTLKEVSCPRSLPRRSPE